MLLFAPTAMKMRRLLQSHGELLNQFDQREVEARDKQQRERNRARQAESPLAVSLPMLVPGLSRPMR